MFPFVWIVELIGLDVPNILDTLREVNDIPPQQESTYLDLFLAPRIKRQTLSRLTRSVSVVNVCICVKVH